MQKRWKKINKLKNNKMENATESVHIRIREKKDPRDDQTQDPDTFLVREYKPRYTRITAYQLGEDSTIHCADETELKGKAGDYYVCLDQVQEFVLSSVIFKKMFLVKTED